VTHLPSQILDAIEAHQVVVIAGETGCGKTTQVPQFLLEAHFAAGQHCRVVCSQPRRISAVSVASRVAWERGENVGESVGYRIRLESKGSAAAPLQFVTNGVLVKMLTAAAADGGDGGFGAGAAPAAHSHLLIVAPLCAQPDVLHRFCIRSVCLEHTARTCSGVWNVTKQRSNMYSTSQRQCGQAA
jgi:hypothetical protein